MKLQQIQHQQSAVRPEEAERIWFGKCRLFQMFNKILFTYLLWDPGPRQIEGMLYSRAQASVSVFG